MSALDGMDLFGSGPHDFRPCPWRRTVQRRAFAGLNGEMALDMGMRSRAILQTGRLQADTASGLRDLIEAIEALVDGRPHTLAQVGERLGVSKERIRQLEARAMAKLRTDFAGAAIGLYGS